MTYNGALDLAVGATAKSRIWKNEKWQWSDLVARLTTEHKTNEKYKDYMAASKSDRSKIKDVGGYVGGYLRAGRRKPDHVVHRQLLTLDIDYAHVDFWDIFQMLFEITAVLHSTHSHSEETPRYRLIIPLDREVSPDEYVAIARRVAGLLDIELFDNTTFETNRLMFWPSNSADVDYYSEYQEGPALSADSILGSYLDWTDSTLWPTAVKQLDDVLSRSKKQEDPLTKKGLIGIFCRRYSIDEAIDTFLQEAYTSTENDRYTYLLGSTASGLITYDDKFAYSHHGTDPCSGKLCNAFDLVRIHKFGHLDQTSETKSFKAMQEFIRSDEGSKKAIAEERLTEAKYDFGGLDTPTEEVDLEWAKGLEINAQGKYLSSSINLDLILNNDPRFKALFRRNEFDNKRYIFGDVPWRKVPTPEPMRNVDYSGVRNYIESVYGITGVSKIDDSLALQFEKRSFHPVREYLNGVEWDGTHRVDTLMIDYFGAEDNTYTREAIRRSLVAAVARVFIPGIKFDMVLTLVGAQGTGKSTFINNLGQQWFSDSFNTVHGKEAFEQLQGAWLIEMAELAGLRKAEVEAVKHFIAKREDTFRPAYAKVPETFKRQCVFFGTTNNPNFLSDPSGDRRFNPIDVRIHLATKIVFDMEQEEIDQIWAEAATAFRAGERLYLGREANRIAFSEQKGHSLVDSRKGLIETYLDVLLPDNWGSLDTFERRLFLEQTDVEGTELRQTVCVVEIWCECLAKQRGDLDGYKSRDINDLMKNITGWSPAKSAKKFDPYGNQRYYTRDL